MPRVSLPHGLSPWQKHVNRWQSCRRCPYHLKRRHVVLARGEVPCDVLFIGEAPGRSEDVLGEPFVGPAGHLLDDIVSRAMDGVTISRNGTDGPPRLAFTNLVACLPLGTDGDKTAEPDKESVIACSPRLQELVQVAKPAWVVLVGSCAKKYIVGTKSLAVDPSSTIRFVEIDHPAYLLRMPSAGRSVAIDRAEMRIRSALLEPF